jgi:hypothetical protein
MPQALICKKCRELFVLMGTAIELVGESRVGYRHTCGAINELLYLSSDENGRALYGVAGVSVLTAPQRMPPV